MPTVCTHRVCLTYTGEEQGESGVKESAMWSLWSDDLGRLRSLTAPVLRIIARSRGGGRRLPFATCRISLDLPKLGGKYLLLSCATHQIHLFSGCFKAQCQVHSQGIIMMCLFVLASFLALFHFLPLPDLLLKMLAYLFLKAALNLFCGIRMCIVDSLILPMRKLNLSQLPRVTQWVCYLRGCKPGFWPLLSSLHFTVTFAHFLLVSAWVCMRLKRWLFSNFHFSEPNRSLPVIPVPLSELPVILFTFPEIVGNTSAWSRFVPEDHHLCIS